MPAIKHPCPHCGKWIMRDVAACPFCGKADPFAPGRCPSCRAIIEDPAWVACPSCGTSLKAAPSAGDTAATPATEAAATAATPAPTVAAAPVEQAGRVATCAGCGGPLPSGARFCAVCGTLVG